MRILIYFLLQDGISRAKFGRTKLRLKGKILPSIGTFGFAYYAHYTHPFFKWTHAFVRTVEFEENEQCKILFNNLMTFFFKCADE
jgi:hypothetical protein